MESKKYKVLIADDDRQLMMQIMTYLSQYIPDFDILTAPNGKIAIKVAELEMPDVIVMDWTMPEMTGLEALERLKANEKTQNIPVVMATALQYPEDIELAFNAGASDYIKKPYHQLELVGRLRNVLRLHGELNRLRTRVKELGG